VDTVRTGILAFSLLAAAPPAPATAFDHSAFDALLRKHVTAGLVDYDAFAAERSFPAYLDSLARFDPSRLGAPERLAYWINTYNAYTIALVNKHGERESIRNINKTLGVIKAKGPWQEEIVRAGGRTMSLDHVEHEIVRKAFREPRIHFALVCAALSCPPLRGEAYTGAALEAQLDDQARAFLLRAPRSNRVDAAAGTVHLSAIFDWFRGDFPAGDAALGAWLARFFPEGAERRLLEGGRFRIVHTHYDWTLNSQAKGRGR
jgi:hypothetical protein